MEKDFEREEELVDKTSAKAAMILECSRDTTRPLFTLERSNTHSAHFRLP